MLKMYTENTGSRKVCMSRDVLWLGKSYGEWKGLAKPAITDDIAAVSTEAPEEATADAPNTPAPTPAIAMAPATTTVHTNLPVECAAPADGTTTRSQTASHSNQKVVNAMIHEEVDL
jgi:hypothetical protein